MQSTYSVSLSLFNVNENIYALIKRASVSDEEAQSLFSRI